MPNVVERLLIVGLITGALIIGWKLLGWWQLRRLKQQPQPVVLKELVPLLGVERPTVLAFSTPGCTECRSLQIPALKRLSERMQDQVEIAYISAPEHPELVSHFGILTVPATVIIDSQGQPQHINLRYIDTERLQAQVVGTLNAAEAA